MYSRDNNVGYLPLRRTFIETSRLEKRRLATTICDVPTLLN